MWRLYYASLRLLSPAARVVFYVQHKLLTVRRTRVAIIRPDGAVLLVKNSLGNRKWTFPGGGVMRGETDELAACREVQEELGIRIEPRELTPLGSMQMNGFVAPLFAAQIDQQRVHSISPHKLEIQAWRWVDFDSDMPLDDMQRVVHHVRTLLSTEERVDRMDDSCDDRSSSGGQV